MNVDKPHLIALRQLDQPEPFEFAKRAADGFDGQTEKITDIASRHGQVEAARIFPLALIAAGEGQQEVDHALSGTALPRSEHHFTGRC
jgi:hypothetical protein